ncbi:ABC transporter permease [Nibrella saemangeumensis]|uniref:ABC transporter permease n=1 Tax=Nibrella saemangeumensis TaxID=1084526 RepID=A0ABP8MDS8_9BACT
MIRNYFKIAWRNLVRNRAFSAINIVGLAIGLATCLLIMLFVIDELSYDRYHEKADRIVRVIFRGTVNGGSMREPSVMPPTAQTLKAEYPEVLEATRIRTAGAPIIAYGEKVFKETAITFADSNFFQVFTFPFLKGDPKTALVNPNTVVITKAVANKYFGNDDPLGKVLTIKSGNAACTVTGVIDPVPANSHFHFDFFVSMASFPESKSTSWMVSEFYTYLVLPEGYDYKKLEAKLPQVVEKHMGPQLQQAFGMSLAQFQKKGNNVGLYLQPLTDIHLHSDLSYDLEPSGDIRYVYIFGTVALFMLLIACINFMNLSTAGASKRSKEVGIRKVLGSVKMALVNQFLTESIVLTGIALVLAIGLVYMALPAFNQLSGKELSLSFTQTPWLLPGLLLFGLLVGVLAGSYPAFFLSSFKPVSVLKGRLTFTGRSRGISLRGGLVVFQFFISIILIIGTTVVYRQLSYIQNMKLGYDKDQVLVLQETWRLGKNEAVFRQQLLQDSRVVNATISGFLPAGPSYNNNFITYADNNSAQYVKALRYDVDDHYIPTLGMQMVAGRNFSPEFGTDSTGIILNETAVKAYGLGANALGHIITHPENDGRKISYRVIGVVKDFHFRSLHERIAPLAMTLGNNNGLVIAKVKTKDVGGLLASVEEQWTKFAVDAPLEYTFLDKRFLDAYRAEQKMGSILGIFAGLTIFVACLGLFGLATFTAEQRTKEIGVRKVLGASVAGIVSMLSRDFLKPVLVAILLASPIAWYVMNRWLQDFAYKISLEWWVFALAGVMAIVIALLTVSFQSIKAALMNPVKSLRAE